MRVLVVVGAALSLAGCSMSSIAASVQSQPPAGSCHARGHGAWSLPDPHCTPGATNPNVTQANIKQTICKAGWTKTVRPPTSVTGPEKLASMRAYGYTGSPRAFEYDHLVSLEIGGATNSAANLWPEPGASPNVKDRVESRLHRKICSGKISLAKSQHEIATNWTTAQ